jgi:oligoendopeptidase F
MTIKQKKRSEIAAEDKWRVNDLVASDEAWESGIADIKAKTEALAAYKGRLGVIENGRADVLLDCLRARDALGEAFQRLYVYAHMKLHEDANDTKYQGYADIATGVSARLMAAESFVEPEILQIDEQTLRVCIEATPGLSLYEHYLENLLRTKAHVLSAEMEELLANAHELSEAPDTIFGMLDNADIKFGTVKDEEGNEVELTHARYGALLEARARDVRRDAWHAYYDGYWYLKNTLAAAHGASVKKDVFFSKARKYPSSLDAALFADNIPTSVYTNLIETVHGFLPSMHRYLSLRKRLLGLDALHVYDLYVPMLPKIDNTVGYKDAIERVLEGLSKLGEGYVDAAREGLSKGGWVDVYENEGKRSGAYSWGAFGCHPYILMNYENKVGDMFTLAHELGHAMHSFYSWGAQPFVYSDYTTFLAEVASTVNEALLMKHLLETTDDAAMRAYLVNEWLEQFKGTLYRQTLFAEFEMKTHRMAEAGEPLTVEVLNALYRELNVKYYGSELALDEKLDLEWARIPHFYSAFYVYQYATGYSAAMAFANRISDKENGKHAAEQYIEFLKSGSSGYSIEILKRAGVDMSSPAPVREALTLFGSLLDEMEKAAGELGL